MAISIIVSKKIFHSLDFINLFIYIIIGGIFYIIPILLLKVDEINELLGSFFKLKKKNFLK